MGITYVEAIVTGPRGKKATVRFLVDSGVTYTLLRLKVWRALGLKPKRTMKFTLADGTEVERDISECHISLPQGEGHTPVILGQEGDEALLGIVTPGDSRTGAESIHADASADADDAVVGQGKQRIAAFPLTCQHGVAINYNANHADRDNAVHPFHLG